MDNLKSKSKEIKAIRKYLLKYLQKMDVYYASAVLEEYKISNRKQIGGKLGAAKRCLNQAIEYRNKINLSDSMWSAILREVQIEHRSKQTN